MVRSVKARKGCLRETIARAGCPSYCAASLAQNAYIKLWRCTVDASKTGRGILASLEHKNAAPLPRAPLAAGTPAARGPTALAAGGMLVTMLLAWWMYSGPSPVMVEHPSAPMAALAQDPVMAEPAGVAAATIINDSPLPVPAPVPVSVPAPSRSLAGAAAPVAHGVVRHGRPPVSRARVATDKAPARVTTIKVPARANAHVAAKPDSDVTLLTALVAHANDKDVVSPHAPDSTGQLLQRCERVGGEEGRLCRIRICDSRAGDGACRAD
jgi:hypothetical protein